MFDFKHNNNNVTHTVGGKDDNVMQVALFVKIGAFERPLSLQNCCAASFPPW
jgi:hypothetical protein